MSLADGFHDLPRGKLAMVVTHLQMTAPAPLRGAGQPSATCSAASGRTGCGSRDWNSTT